MQRSHDAEGSLFADKSMTPRKKIHLAFKGSRLIISGRPYQVNEMAAEKAKKIQDLEKLHRKLFKEQPALVRPESDSLEQPYAGEVVDTLTTYSVYGEPVREE